VHKDLTPLLPSEVAGYAAVVFFLILSSMGGMGGSGAVIIISLLLFGFDTKMAIGLSNSSICTASTYRYFYTMDKPHPLKNGTGTINDYNISILMLPMIVVGASVGTMVNKLLPAVVLPVVFALIMLSVSLATGSKFCLTNKEEAAKLGPLCSGKHKVHRVVQMAEKPTP
jgi:uncharacterized membrane protein YfcA